MKKIIVLTIITTFCFAGLVLAELQKPAIDDNKTYVPLEVPEHLKNATPSSYRDNVNPAPPDYEFTREPVQVGDISYYDYMPGSYCSHPLRRQKEGLTAAMTGLPFGPGIYLIYHGRPGTAPEINRRVYYAYVAPDGTISNATITSTDRWQGYPGMDIHPYSGDPIASWHEIIDENPEGTQTSITYDDIEMLGVPGFWQTPTYFPQPVPGVEEYIWPYIEIGPSPTYDTDGTLRVYQVSQRDPDGFPEDELFRYVDVPGEDYVYGDLAAIMNLDNWSEPQKLFDIVLPSWPSSAYIRPYPSFAVDWNTPGHIAFIGYAGFYAIDTLTTEPIDPGFYVWESFDGGETWDYANFHSCPIIVDPGDNLNRYVLYEVENIPGFAPEAGADPYDHLDIWGGWPGSMHLTHRSALYDRYGNLHAPIQLWIGHVDAVAGSASYWPAYLFHFEAEIVYNADGTWELNHVPKMPGTDPSSGYSVPWTWTATDTLVYPWLTMAYTDVENLGFHENIQHQAMCPENNWMVQIWADGTELLKAENPTITYPTPTDMNYLNHPIISISAKGGHLIGDGQTWSDPIRLSDVYDPHFTGQTTVYPYVAPYIKKIDDEWGEIYIYYFNDNDYGSSIQNIGPQTGGYIMYTSIKIHFGISSIDEPGNIESTALILSNYPNPFTNSTRIAFSAAKSIKNAIIKIYNTKGQLVRTLEPIADSSPSTGYAIWDGKDNNNHNVANGIYLYKLETNNGTIAKKMLLVR